MGKKRESEEGTVVFTYEVLIGGARRSVIENIKRYRKAKQRLNAARPGIMPNAHLVAQEAHREMLRCKEAIITGLRVRAACMTPYEELMQNKPWPIRFPVMGGCRKVNG